ncbi:glycosyltransferase family 1 protein [Paenibacillus sp. MAH-36]|uniref:Glycosyltransferase family 1 protein n=1 Tax=Paenibacillus violae TaxID=3077234 RepID=A0ABU3RHN9_9BACL|nr:glycosyltransferase family 1 protein [Paenibacillus sp. PFR10]MDU0203792.1 glycosyltransferase family 1 protein [Paenibacillus sp. PFR10]
MSKILCVIRLGEVPLHLYHIISGFILLERQGIIDLKVERLGKGHPERLPYNMIEARVNGIQVLYDLNDGYDNLLREGQDFVDFLDSLLNKFHICFKRSFSPHQNSKLKHANKMLPLGLNYMVTVPGNTAHFPTPEDPKKEKIKKIIRMIPFSEYYNGRYYMNFFEGIPSLEKDPKILFMARLWDVEGDYAGQLSSSKKEERRYINEFRASCIRLCKKEFGPSFYGGVNSTGYASKYYADLIIDDKKVTKRNHYIERVKKSSICIATMGLHESIGWKFAEYVAASKAIATEELHYDVPGDFREGQNYLAFRTPSDCIDKIYRLKQDNEFRYKMMVNNYNYYHNFVRPDRIVFQSILAALQYGDYKSVQLERELS